jgi:hypothetical protein
MLNSQHEKHGQWTSEQEALADRSAFHYVQKRLIPRNDARSCEGAAFLLQSEESLFVMPRNDTTFGSCFQTLQPLGTCEPGWMISGQPSLRNTITPVFDYLYRPCEHYFQKVAKEDLHGNGRL